MRGVKRDLHNGPARSVDRQRRLRRVRCGRGHKHDRRVSELVQGVDYWHVGSGTRTGAMSRAGRRPQAVRATSVTRTGVCETHQPASRVVSVAQRVRATAGARILGRTVRHTALARRCEDDDDCDDYIWPAAGHNGRRRHGLPRYPLCPSAGRPAALRAAPTACRSGLSCLLHATPSHRLTDSGLASGLARDRDVVYVVGCAYPACSFCARLRWRPAQEVVR